MWRTKEERKARREARRARREAKRAERWEKREARREKRQQKRAAKADKYEREGKHKKAARQRNKIARSDARAQRRAKKKGYAPTEVSSVVRPPGSVEPVDDDFLLPEFDLIEWSAEANLEQPYGSGNQCDDWNKKVLDQAEVDTSELYAGPTNTTTVAEHINMHQNQGTSQSSPDEGWNQLFMDDSPVGYNPHAALVKKTDGGVTVYHQSNSEPGVSRREELYASQEAFESDFGYNRFHYVPIE